MWWQATPSPPANPVPRFYFFFAQAVLENFFEIDGQLAVDAAPTAAPTAAVA